MTTVFQRNPNWFACAAWVKNPDAHPPEMTVGDLLRYLRIDRGLTLGDVGRATGLGVVVVSDLERDRDLNVSRVDLHLAACGAGPLHVRLVRALQKG